MNSAAQRAKRCCSCLVFLSLAEDKTRLKAFAFGDFISFDKRQKKRSKEKRFPVHGKPDCSLMKGFFYATSMSHRKTPHIHVRRPPGLRVGAGSSGSLEAQKRKAEYQKRKQSPAFTPAHHPRAGRPAADYSRSRGRPCSSRSSIAARS